MDVPSRSLLVGQGRGSPGNAASTRVDRPVDETSEARQVAGSAEQLDAVTVGTEGDPCYPRY
jgi:hypothetical protein